MEIKYKRKILNNQGGCKYKNLRIHIKIVDSVETNIITNKK